MLDASMAAAFVFADEQTEAALAIMQRVTIEGAVVPSLWHLEIASIFRIAERRGRCDAALADAFLELLARLPIEVDRETNLHAWHTTRALSRDHGLTPYDAAYLELAMRLGLPLASGDRELLHAARQLDVPVLTP
ncbi:type II toxin-antitoxin system VapC family toxin [Novosphingobium sp.]|uniref:type II toxin-antitoxin system VapC family toxin n=1 Tax=Novosphingobium sp. TaxID=1874826 RepID=UPI00262B5E4D|nr:type II toxin-antitoxin system VapC family toxin [Novosphingobium sp.]